MIEHGSPEHVSALLQSGDPNDALEALEHFFEDLRSSVRLLLREEGVESHIVRNVLNGMGDYFMNHYGE